MLYPAELRGQAIDINKLVTELKVDRPICYPICYRHPSGCPDLARL
jgi:hypothetical protein